MVFSKMQYGSKVIDGVLSARGLFRLEAFLVTVKLKTNFTAAFVTIFMVAVLLGLVLIVRKFRNGKCMCLSDQTMDKILTALRSIILFTMQ